MDASDQPALPPEKMNLCRCSGPTPLRLTVSLFVTASIFIGGSVQAGWQKDMVLGNDNNSGGGNYSRPAGPTAAQIQEQRRENAAHDANAQGNIAYDKKDWAAAEAYYRQALKNTPYDPVIIKNLAETQNEEGIAAYNKGDYATAAKFLQQALANFPASDEKDCQTIRNNLAQAQKQADDAKTQTAEFEAKREQNQIQDQAAANTMKDSLGSMVNSLSSENTVDSPQSRPSAGTSSGPGGLAFTDSDPTLKDAVADKSIDEKVKKDYLGGRKSNPGDLTAGQNPTPPAGANNNAQQALTALNDVGPSGGGKQQIFDTPGPQGKNITPANVPTPTAISDMPEIPKGMEGDDVIKDGVTRLNTWLPQLKQAKEDVKKAQAAVDQAKTREDKKAAQDTLAAAQIKSQGSQQMVDSAKDQIVKRTVYLKPFAVGGAVTPAPATAQGQPTPPASDPQSSANTAGKN